MDIRGVIELLRGNADPERAGQMAAYMKDKFPFLGIQTPLRKKLSREFLKEVRKSPVTDWNLIDELWALPEREFQYLAEDYLTTRQKFLVPADLDGIKRLATTKSWWDTVDSLDRIAGQIALAYPESNATLLAWSTDDSMWLRRLAIDHQLVRKEATNTQLLAEILQNNLGQTEFFINKAIGWALRDYSKTNPAWVRNFIEEHRNQMAPLSIREASKYL